MTAKEISVKTYVVRLSGEERQQLETLIRKGKSPARRLLKARILLKADVSEAGEGWSDSRIKEALDASSSMVYRVRKQLVEEGLAAVLSHKQRARPAVSRIFDGEKEAKLITLACSNLRRDARAGLCGCWRTRSWNSALSIAPATARSGARSRKYFNQFCKSGSACKRIGSYGLECRCELPSAGAPATTSIAALIATSDQYLLLWSAILTTPDGKSKMCN